jgi:hypothetical protein
MRWLGSDWRTIKKTPFLDSIGKRVENRATRCGFAWTSWLEISAWPTNRQKSCQNLGDTRTARAEALMGVSALRRGVSALRRTTRSSLGRSQFAAQLPAARLFAGGLCISADATVRCVFRFIQSRIAARCLGLALGVALLAGCGSETTQLEPNDPSRIRMQTLAIGYARYLNRNDGKLPANETELKRFIAIQGMNSLTQRGITNVDELFVSPRDGQPLVVSYGTEKLVRGFTADPIVAHEQTGVGGRRLVAFPSGAVVELEPEMFHKLPLAKDLASVPTDAGE